MLDILLWTFVVSIVDAGVLWLALKCTGRSDDETVYGSLHGGRGSGDLWLILSVLLWILFIIVSVLLLTMTIMGSITVCNTLAGVIGGN